MLKIQIDIITKRVRFKVAFLHFIPKERTRSPFTMTAEIHALSLVNFYGQYADRHMILKFMRRVSERGKFDNLLSQKKKLMSVFNAPVLLLTMNFVITLSK